MHATDTSTNKEEPRRVVVRHGAVRRTRYNSNERRARARACASASNVAAYPPPCAGGPPNPPRDARLDSPYASESSGELSSSCLVHNTALLGACVCASVITAHSDPSGLLCPALRVRGLKHAICCLLPARHWREEGPQGMGRPDVQQWTPSTCTHTASKKLHARTSAD